VIRLWIDTDIGGDPDDAIALCAAVHHPRAELIGVSTVDADVERRAVMARRLFDQLRVSVPVHAGVLPDAALADVDALLTIGPLTNLAAAIARDARLPAKIVVMGGAVRPVEHRGRIHEREHNFATDPAAAAQVVREVARLIVVPLDVTAALLLDREEEDALAATAGVVADEIAAFRAEGDRVCLHDPLALLTVLDDAPIAIAPRPLVVEPDGRVRVDEQLGTSHDVVVDVDARAAVQRVLDTCTARNEGD
jgi:inosine-uridine nucleoside N-ribohydrolase